MRKNVLILLIVWVTLLTGVCCEKTKKETLEKQLPKREFALRRFYAFVTESKASILKQTRLQLKYFREKSEKQEME